jgi:hypothetical protein
MRFFALFFSLFSNSSIAIGLLKVQISAIEALSATDSDWKLKTRVHLFPQNTFLNCSSSFLRAVKQVGRGWDWQL